MQNFCKSIIMKEIFYLVAIVAGLAVVTQAGVNSQLQLAVKSPIVSALISFLVGTLVLITAILVTNPKSIGSIGSAASLSWWKLTGGFLGAFYICSIILGVPKIGAANMLGFAVASQLIFAVIFDHFGWLGFPC
jgi:transporter family-2 protein